MYGKLIRRPRLRQKWQHASISASAIYNTLQANVYSLGWYYFGAESPTKVRNLQYLLLDTHLGGVISRIPVTIERASITLQQDYYMRMIYSYILQASTHAKQLTPPGVHVTFDGADRIYIYK